MRRLRGPCFLVLFSIAVFSTRLMLEVHVISQRHTDVLTLQTTEVPQQYSLQEDLDTTTDDMLANSSTTPIESISKAGEVHNTGPQPDFIKSTLLQTNHFRVISYPRPQGFLTIGIPSVQRKGGMGKTYLLQTLESIINNMSPADRLISVVVVFLADLDVNYNNEVAKLIIDKHGQLITSGFIHILQVSPDYYPKLDGLKRNFNDVDVRVKWRAKQVADFAAMFVYARNISQFYLQLEDDVICATNFLSAIRDFINSHNTHWALLEFSELGFIGKLFKSVDLEKLAKFMMTFYEEQPVDWLIIYFRLTMAQTDVILRKPTLFQHMGIKSSLSIKSDVVSKDRYFDRSSKRAARGAAGRQAPKPPVKVIDSLNPPAVVFSNIRPYLRHTVENAYMTRNFDFFWAVDVQANDTITILFDHPQLIRRITVATGNVMHQGDILGSGRVEVSPRVIANDLDRGTSECVGLRTVASFRAGRVDVIGVNDMLKGTKVKCLKMVVDAAQKEWVIFDQIRIYAV